MKRLSILAATLAVLTACGSGPEPAAAPPPDAAESPELSQKKARLAQVQKDIAQADTISDAATKQELLTGLRAEEQSLTQQIAALEQAAAKPPEPKPAPAPAPVAKVDIDKDLEEALKKAETAKPKPAEPPTAQAQPAKPPEPKPPEPAPPPEPKPVAEGPKPPAPMPAEAPPKPKEDPAAKVGVSRYDPNLTFEERWEDVITKVKKELETYKSGRR